MFVGHLEVGVQSPLGAGGHEPEEGPDVSPVAQLQELVVGAAVREADGDRGVAGLHEDEVHQQSGRASVPVHEGMDVHQPVMSQTCN